MQDWPDPIIHSCFPVFIIQSTMNANQQPNLGGVLTPSDAGTMPASYFFISFSTAGAITAVPAGQSAAVTIPSGALAAGIVHPIAFSRVKSTGTDANSFCYWT